MRNMKKIIVLIYSLIFIKAFNRKYNFTFPIVKFIVSKNSHEYLNLWFTASNFYLTTKKVMDEKRHSWGAPHGMPPVWGWLPSLLLRWQLLLIIPSGIQLFPWPWPGHGKQLNTTRNNLKIFISLFWGQFSGYKTLISFFSGASSVAIWLTLIYMWYNDIFFLIKLKGWK